MKPSIISLLKLIRSALAGVAALIPCSASATDLADFAAMEWIETYTGTTFAPTGWNLTFSDNFPYDPILANIKPDTGTVGPWYAPGHSDYGVGWLQSPSDPEFPNTFISLSGGGLKMRAHRNSTTTQDWYTAGLASVNNKGAGWAQTYGYYEISCELPVSIGRQGKFEAWPAFWLLTQNGYDSPRLNNRVEIDAIEWYSGDPLAHHGSVHLINAAGVRKTNSNYFGFGYNLSNAPHTFGVKVTPSWVITYMDRKEVGRYPSVEEFSLPMYMLVNNAISAPSGDRPDYGETEWNFIVKNVSAYAMPREVIIDNTSGSGFTLTPSAGSWTAATTTTGFYGANYLHDQSTGKGTKTAKYTPVLPCDGAYEVFARWTSNTNRATNVPYTIASAEGTQTVAKNQTLQGGQWVSLGTYYFREGAAGSVTISNNGTAAGTYVIADAIRFSLVDPYDQVVDNTDTTRIMTTGTWTAATTPAGFQGTNYLHDGGTSKGSKSVRFSANIPRSGSYQVYGRWASNALQTLANASFESDPSGAQTISGWSESGGNPAASFTASSSTAKNGPCYLAHQAAAAYDVTTYQTKTGLANGKYSLKAWVQRVGNQTVAQMEASNYGGSTLVAPIAAGSTWVQISIPSIQVTNGQCTIGFRSVAPAGATLRVDQVELYTNNWANNVPIDIVHSGGTDRVLVDQQSNGGKWVLLGTYNFTPGGGGSALISNTGTAAGTLVCADAVKFVKSFDALGTIVDNSGATVSSGWTSATATSNYYGSDYLHDGGAGKGSKSIRFTPTLPHTGLYEVFARWSPGSNRATNVPVEIVTASGTSSIQVNQQLEGRPWTSLGLYRFNAGTGGSVLISNTGTAPGTYVMADAVSFVLRK